MRTGRINGGRPARQWGCFVNRFRVTTAGFDLLAVEGLKPNFAPGRFSLSVPYRLSTSFRKFELRTKRYNNAPQPPAGPYPTIEPIYANHFHHVPLMAPNDLKCDPVRSQRYPFDRPEASAVRAYRSLVALMNCDKDFQDPGVELSECARVQRSDTLLFK